MLRNKSSQSSVTLGNNIRSYTFIMSCFSNMLFCVSEMNLPEMSMEWQGLAGGNVMGILF